jgi:hypothetical protein
MARWRYSRKTPGPYQAYDKLRISRVPRADKLLTKTGTFVRQSDSAWLVSFDDEEGRYWVSKTHAERADDSTWEIPEWLWETMIEGGPR